MGRELSESLELAATEPRTVDLETRMGRELREIEAMLRLVLLTNGTETPDAPALGQILAAVVKARCAEISRA